MKFIERGSNNCSKPSPWKTRLCTGLAMVATIGIPHLPPGVAHAVQSFETRTLRVTGYISYGLGQANPTTGESPFTAVAATGGFIHALLKPENATFDAHRIDAKLQMKTQQLIEAQATGGVKGDFPSQSPSGGSQMVKMNSQSMTYLTTPQGAKIIFPTSVHLAMTKSVNQATADLQGDSGFLKLSRESNHQLEPSSGLLTGHVTFHYSSIQPAKSPKKPKTFYLTGTAESLRFMLLPNHQYQLILNGHVHLRGSLGNTTSDTTTDTITVDLSSHFEPLDMNSNNEPADGNIQFKQKQGESGSSDHKKH